jgi:hypothetical protein
MILATVPVISGGCNTAIKTTRVVAPGTKPVVRDATRKELIAAYQAMAQKVRTVNATVDLQPTTGSQYSGIIEEYHQVKAFLLARRPALVRMIGQAPVIGTTIFDMASDGETFHVHIPSKQKFLVGAIALERSSKKPIENLRPQHLLDALLWPEMDPRDHVLMEEFNDESGRYYILTVLHGADAPEIARKIWYDRATLQVARLVSYGTGGALVSDVRVSDWEPLEQAAGGAAGELPAAFPRRIQIARPHDDYQIDLHISKLAVNTEIPTDRFELPQPPGTELVRVGANQEEKKP